MKSWTSYSIETSNRFEVITDEVCTPILVDHEEINSDTNIEYKLKPGDYRSKTLRNKTMQRSANYQRTKNRRVSQINSSQKRLHPLALVYQKVKDVPSAWTIILPSQNSVDG